MKIIVKNLQWKPFWVFQKFIVGLLYIVNLNQWERKWLTRKILHVKKVRSHLVYCAIKLNVIAYLMVLTWCWNQSVNTCIYALWVSRGDSGCQILVYRLSLGGARDMFLQYTSAPRESPETHIRQPLSITPCESMVEMAC